MVNPEKKFTWAWIAWGVMFLIIEVIALKRRNGETLSEHVWRWIDVRNGWGAARVGVLGFTVWLVIHFQGWDMSLLGVAIQ